MREKVLKWTLKSYKKKEELISKKIKKIKAQKVKLKEGTNFEYDVYKKIKNWDRNEFLDKQLRFYNFEYRKIIDKIVKIKNHIQKEEQKRKDIQGNSIFIGRTNKQTEEKIEFKNNGPVNITEQIIEENLLRVERGEPLTMPLSKLGPIFKLRYNLKVHANVPLNEPARNSWENLNRRKKYFKTCSICKQNFISNEYAKRFCSEKCKQDYLKLLKSDDLNEINLKKIFGIPISVFNRVEYVCSPLLSLGGKD